MTHPPPPAPVNLDGMPDSSRAARAISMRSWERPSARRHSWLASIQAPNCARSIGGLVTSRRSGGGAGDKAAMPWGCTGTGAGGGGGGGESGNRAGGAGSAVAGAAQGEATAGTDGERAAASGDGDGTGDGAGVVGHSRAAAATLLRRATARVERRPMASRRASVSAGRSRRSQATFSTRWRVSRGTPVSTTTRWRPLFSAARKISPESGGGLPAGKAPPGDREMGSRVGVAWPGARL